MAPRAPPVAGSFPRSFPIPGTNTSIAIGGYVKFAMAEWLTGGGPNVSNGILASSTGSSVTATLPLKLPNPPGIPASPFNASARGNGVFHTSAAESRLRVETRTPTAWGEAQTVLEFDFYGCIANTPDCRNLAGGTNPVLPRLRLAYGTLGGFLAGQNGARSEICSRIPNCSISAAMPASSVSTARRGLAIRGGSLPA